MAFALPGIFLLARREGSFGSGIGRWWAVAAGVTFFLDLWGWHASMSHTSAANATLLVGGLSPVWVALFSVCFLRLRFGTLGWIGQAASLGGALVLGLARGARVGDGLGEGIALGASFAYASYTLVLGRARQSLKAPQALFWTSLACLACFGVAILLRGDPLTGFTPKAWTSLVALGLIVQLLAWWLISWGLGAIGLQAQQVATILLAWPILGEVPKPLGLLGAALIAAGIAAVALSPRRFAAS
jgi:drug/metabolite transporter (DMT)-like permease